MLKSSFDVKLRKKEGRGSDVFILESNPLRNVEKMISLPMKCLYLKDAPYYLCVCVFIHSWTAHNVLNSESV